MALNKETQYANRYGLNVKVYAYSDTELATPLLTIDFANLSEISISRERVWATGGQDHANKIGFNDPIVGSFKLSTQIMTAALLRLVSGEDVSAETTIVTFKNDNSSPSYFIVTAETVWQDENGNTYSEDMTFCKACPKCAYNISYSGTGDPTSVDVEFDLMANADKEVLIIDKAASQ